MSQIFKEFEKYDKQHIHLVCIGHRDHGKSSVLGRLFFDTDNIGQEEMKRIKIMAKEMGREGFEYAFIMDQIKEERMRGITIGLAHKKLETKKNSFTFADAPGHKDFIKNMLTGASEADAAILVVAADEGVQDQTREHLFLSKMLGLPRVVVILHKMDLFDYKKEKFEEVKKDIEKLLKQVGYEVSEAPIIPCSALFGDNIVKKSEKMNWYQGPTLLEILENLPEREVPSHLGLRLPVQDIYEIEGRVAVIGRLNSGQIKVGDKVLAMPQDKQRVVEKMYIHDKEIQKAMPGDNIYLYLKDLKRDDIKRNDIIGKPDDRPTITNRFKAQVMILNHPEPITDGYQTLYEMLTESVPCTISKLLKKIDTQSGAIQEENPKEINQGESALIEIETAKPIYIEAQSKNPHLAGFRLMEKDHRIAMGICVETL